MQNINSLQKIQNLLDRADELRNSGVYDKSIKYYLDALDISLKEKGEDGVANDEVHSKIWFMACNGMGISYAKLGKFYDAIENFEDAIAFAPNEEVIKTAQNNLDKYKKAVKNKTGMNIHTY